MMFRMALAAEGLDEQILRLLHIEAPPRDLSPLARNARKSRTIPQGEVRIGVVGKYVRSKTPTRVCAKRWCTAAWRIAARAVIEWIEAEDIDSPADRGAAPAPRRRHSSSGRLRQARHSGHGPRHPLRAREARSRSSAFVWACSAPRSNTRATSPSLEHADSTEFDPPRRNRVIYKLRELLGVDEMGGTMRLGAWPCKLEPGSFAAEGLWHTRKSPNAIATATNSIATMKKR